MKIAIFGGSFDPPHIGHEQIVKLILNSLEIDLLFIVPAFLSPFKSQYFLSPQTRLNLIEKLFEDEKRVIVSDYEVNAGESVPTIKTVKYLYDKYKPQKVYLIIGDDHLSTLSKWNSFDELSKLVEFIVINRHDIQTDYKSLPLKIEVSSSKLREHLDIDSIPQKIKNEVNEIWKKEYNK